MRRALIVWFMTAALVAAAADSGTVFVPSTISPRWHQFWSHFAWPVEILPAPDDVVGWDAARDRHDALIRRYVNPNLARDMHVGLKSGLRNGVTVLEVRPSDISDSHQVILYMHGGAYTFQNPELNLLQAALMANATKLLVVSIDYTLAPRGKWTGALDQVIAVYRSILSDGFAPSAIGFFGDSAGGGLAAGSALKIRDMNLPLPGAIVLWSPWSDITASGDTYVTLANADPLLSVEALSASAAAYAAPADQKNPYVSAVYGDYSKPYPPTLIQGGTKEIFLSNFVRLYQAIDVGGGIAKLDLYEGMPHVFQIIDSDSPESQRAVRKSAEFMKKYLSSPSVNKDP